GTALAHFGVGFANLRTATLGATAGLSVAIGTAEALEALAAGALLKRFASFPRSLGEASEVLRLMTLGGPVAATVGATLATAGFRILGDVPASDTATTWFSWWMASGIGAAVFAPLALLWCKRPIRAGLRRKLSVTVPLGMIFAFALVLFAQVGARERERSSADLDRRVDEVAN